MTYSGFLVIFLVIPIVLLLLFLWGRLRCFHRLGLGLVCLLAFVYTTPWDNYAAFKHLWSFDPAFVWGRPFWVGWLPLEEYLFYLAEAVFVCLTVVALSRIPFFAPNFDDLNNTETDKRP